MVQEQYSDALQHPPSFDELVALIEKLFRDYNVMTKLFTPEEIDKGWHRYKILNHLYQDSPVTKEREIAFGDFLKRFVPIDMGEGEMVWWDKKSIGGQEYSTAQMHDLWEEELKQKPA